MNMALADKKVVVWFKGRHIIQRVCANLSEPTLPLPGCYQVIAVFDGLGNLDKVDVHADGITISFGDIAMAFGNNVRSADPQNPHVIDLSEDE